MFVKNVYTFRNLPVEERERMWTDCICTIIGAVFALTLFIIACASFNRSIDMDMKIIFTKLIIRLKVLENCVTLTFPITPLYISDNLLIARYNGIV